jgi:hypothetical protein
MASGEAVCGRAEHWFAGASRLVPSIGGAFRARFGANAMVRPRESSRLLTILEELVSYLTISMGDHARRPSDPRTARRDDGAFVAQPVGKHAHDHVEPHLGASTFTAMTSSNS